MSLWADHIDPLVGYTAGVAARRRRQAGRRAGQAARLRGQASRRSSTPPRAARCTRRTWPRRSWPTTRCSPSRSTPSRTRTTRGRTSSPTPPTRTCSASRASWRTRSARRWRPGFRRAARTPAPAARRAGRGSAGNAMRGRLPRGWRSSVALAVVSVTAVAGSRRRRHAAAARRGVDRRADRRRRPARSGRCAATPTWSRSRSGCASRRPGSTPPLVRLGRAADGSIEVPAQFDVAGWFAEGPRPGQPGPAVVLGHVDSRTGPAVFYRVAALPRDAQVLVDRADGSTVGVPGQRHAARPEDRVPHRPGLRPDARAVAAAGDVRWQLRPCQREAIGTMSSSMPTAVVVAGLRAGGGAARPGARGARWVPRAAAGRCGAAAGDRGAGGDAGRAQPADRRHARATRRRPAPSR